MNHPRAAAICLAALLLPADSPAAVPVEVSVPSPVDGPLEAKVYLEELSGPASTELRDKALLEDVTLPWRGVVEVAQDRRFRLEVRGSGFLCATDEFGAVHSTGPTEPVGCRMVPAGAITGSLRVSPPPDSPPRFLRMTYQSAEPKSQESATAPGSRDFLFCAVDDDRFECPMPAGTLNVRMDLEGYGAQFFWSQDIAPGTKRKLGRLHFTRGASVAGAVVGHGSAGTPDASVELRPRLAARDAYRNDERALELRAATAGVDPNGRFMFPGVEPGEYVLVATAPDFCAAESRLRVHAGDSLVHLEAPIALESCARLEAFIEPTSDFGGESWSLTLQAADVSGPPTDVDRSEAAGLNGYAVFGELKAGMYDLEIRDHAGDTWWSQRIDVYAGLPPVFIEIGAVHVRGRASRGDEPIDGKLIFGTRNRRPSVSMEIGEEGSFEGYLPFEGPWALELDRDGHRQFLDPVTVEVPAGKSHAEVEISLPDTLVAGKVVEGGEPVEGAIVTVLRDTERIEKELFAKTDEDGGFNFSGMRTGRLQMRAAAGRLVSEWRFLNLAEGDEIEDLELELAATVAVRGRVSVQGRGVPGARIVGFPSKSAGELLATGGATAADGSFDVKISSDAERLDLVIFAPGHEALLALARPTARGEDWPPVELSLQGVGGSVVLRTDDSSFRGSVSFGGAVVPLRTFVNLMVQEERLGEEQHRGTSFQGLAAGVWTFCRQGAQSHCVTRELFPGEVATVELFERTSE